MIAGVAGGLAEYFNVDPILVRLAFIILAFANGLGVIAYIALWIMAPKALEVQPEEVSKPGAVVSPGEKRREGWLWAGVLLILLGISLSINNLSLRFSWGPFIFWLTFLPLLLIVAGLILIWRWRKQGS